MWIKICANTNLEDARLAAELGADAIGFVFAASARRMTPEAVAGITWPGQPGGVELIGVFGGVKVLEVERTVKLAGLTGVQLHGGLDLGLIDSIRQRFGAKVSITQTLHWDVEASVEAAAQSLQEQMEILQQGGGVDRVLVDTRVGGVLGGTGRRFDWEAGRGVFAAAREMRMVAAGGLGPDNVGEAVERLRPWGVDVASGVEREPGRKDPERLRLFIHRARAAASLTTARGIEPGV